MQLLFILFLFVIMHQMILIEIRDWNQIERLPSCWYIYNELWEKKYLHWWACWGDYYYNGKVIWEKIIRWEPWKIYEKITLTIKK